MAKIIAFLNKMWKDPVFSKIISSGLILILGWILNLFSDGWILSMLVKVFHTFTIFLFYKIAVIYVISLLIVVFTFYKYYPNKNPLKYKKDTIRGQKLIWEYHDNTRISTITFICSKCGCLMDTGNDPFVSELKCTECTEKKLNPFKSKDDFEICINNKYIKKFHCTYPLKKTTENR